MVAIVTEDDYCILRRDANLKLIKVSASSKVKMERQKFSLAAAIGQPYGRIFTVERDGLVLVAPENATGSSNDPAADLKVDSNKQTYNDTQDNQKMSRDDISEMKEGGASGIEIVAELVANSATYAEKSDFAKLKYVAKKNKKHVFKIQILRPTLRLLAEMTYGLGPARINFLRPDSLALVLNAANVYSGSRVLCVDNCCGLLVCGILERMGGSPDSLLMEFFAQQLPILECHKTTAPALNLDTTPLRPFPLDRVEYLTESYDGTFEETLRAEFNCDKPNITAEQRAAREQRLSSYVKTRALLRSVKFDAVVIASRYDPLPLVERFVPLLAPGRSVVIFSHTVEPLKPAWQYLRDSATRLQLYSPFVRAWQVLPARTHPVLQMDSNHGYLLTATTTAASSHTKGE